MGIPQTLFTSQYFLFSAKSMKVVLAIFVVVCSGIATAKCPAAVDGAVFTSIKQNFSGGLSAYDWVISPTTLTVQTPPGTTKACGASVYFGQYQGGTSIACLSGVPTATPLTDGCEFSGTGTTDKSRVFKITLACDQSTSTLQPPAVIDVTQSGSTFTYAGTFRINSVCDGGSSSPGGSFAKEACSGGCAFLIVFFVGTFAYAIVAILYNVLREGKRGLDAAPHPELWLQLPALVKDGVLFTIQCIRCKGSSSGYQQV